MAPYFLDKVKRNLIDALSAVLAAASLCEASDWLVLNSLEPQCISPGAIFIGGLSTNQD